VFWKESKPFCPADERVKFTTSLAKFKKHLLEAKQSQSKVLVGAKNRRGRKQKQVLRQQVGVTQGRNEATAASRDKNKRRTDEGQREATAASNADAYTTNPTTDVKRFRISGKSFAAGAAGSEGSVIGPGVVAQPEMCVAGGGCTLPKKSKAERVALLQQTVGATPPIPAVRSPPPVRSKLTRPVSFGGDGDGVRSGAQLRCTPYENRMYPCTAEKTGPNVWVVHHFYAHHTGSRYLSDVAIASIQSFSPFYTQYFWCYQDPSNLPHFANVYIKDASVLIPKSKAEHLMARG